MSGPYEKSYRVPSVRRIEPGPARMATDAAAERLIVAVPLRPSEQAIGKDMVGRVPQSAKTPVQDTPLPDTAKNVSLIRTFVLTVPLITSPFALTTDTGIADAHPARGVATAEMIKKDRKPSTITRPHFNVLARVSMDTPSVTRAFVVLVFCARIGASPTRTPITATISDKSLKTNDAFLRCHNNGENVALFEYNSPV